MHHCRVVPPWRVCPFLKLTPSECANAGNSPRIGNVQLPCVGGLCVRQAPHDAARNKAQFDWLRMNEAFL